MITGKIYKYKTKTVIITNYKKENWNQLENDNKKLNTMIIFH